MHGKSIEFDPTIETAVKVYSLVNNRARSIVDEDRLLSMILGINDSEMHTVSCLKGHPKRFQTGRQNWTCIRCIRKHREGSS